MTASQNEPRASTRVSLAVESIRLARQSLKRGEQREAHHWAEQAASLAPEMEEPWLLLAAVADPEASLFYLKRALEINPGSKRARAGMHWGIKRLRAERTKLAEGFEAATAPTKPLRLQPAPELEETRPVAISPPPPRLPPRRDLLEEPAPSRKSIPRWSKLLPWTLMIFCLIVVILGWHISPVIRSAFKDRDLFSLAKVNILQASPTFTTTSTCTGTPTNTPASTSTPTPTSTDTLAPTSTETLTPTPTFTLTSTPADTAPPPPPPIPTETSKPKKKRIQNPVIPGLRPPNVGPNDRWVDVDLSSQTTCAYQGDQVVNRFLVSTGLWPNLTVTGVYRVYVKYRYANMSGDDYFLPNVPYIMYFFKGYGLHGTYWHNNFGYPMSHGCINLRIDDASWLFNWAGVGTVISIHQ